MCFNTPEANKILFHTTNDPAASYWLKKTMFQLDQRDPVDVCADLVCLMTWCQLKMDEIHESLIAQKKAERDAALNNTKTTTPTV